jgi:SAM-dependent methyltransferase
MTDMYSSFDRKLRKFLPSVAIASYNPIVRIAGDAIANMLAIPFRELRDLPPNHLRIRVGVGNRILGNHVHFLEMGRKFWLEFLSRQYCKFDSDVVELGCGCGRIARPLKDSWFEGSYLGVDVDSDMINYCKCYFPSDRFQFLLSPHKSKTYSGRTAESAQSSSRTGALVLEPESKDFVYSVSLYSHLLQEQFEDYLRESFRVLRCGGLMYLTFFCIEDVELGERWSFAHRLGNAYLESTNFPEAAVAYHRADVRHWANLAGFRDVTIIARPVQSLMVARK